MKAFGMQIRKSNTVNLYKDVDDVLHKAGLTSSVTQNGIEKVAITGEIQSMTAALRLQKMLTQSYFSVCDIDAISKMTGIIIPYQRQQLYNTLHCINFNTMSSEYRQVITAMVLDDFREILNP